MHCRVEQFIEIDTKSAEKPQGTSRQTATMKYSAKKTNADEQQRAKTVDIVRLKAGKESLFFLSLGDDDIKYMY